MSAPLLAALLGPGCTAFADGLAPLLETKWTLDRIEASIGAPDAASPWMRMFHNARRALGD